MSHPAPIIRLFAALALLAAAPSLLSAQVRVVPQIGLWAPLSDLPSAGDAREVGERESTVAVGLGIGLGSADGTSFRVTALHGTDIEVPVDEVGCTECARSSVTALTGTVVLRPVDLVVVRPYVLLGAGLRRLDFEREDLDQEGYDALFSDENDLAGHVGLGAELGLPLFDVTVELSDVVSSFEGPGGESEVQHDLFLMLGLVIG